MTRSPRKAVAASALVAGAAMIAAVLPSGVATADVAGQSTARTQAKARAGALSVRLSPSQRGELLAAANASKAATARSLHLSSQEELIVKSVLKDADGTLHTRYERTFAGLPVLGGDLVVHTAANGSTKGATKATDAPITVASTAAARSAGSAKAFALGRAKAKGVAKATAGTARKIVWAATGAPTLAWETVIGGTQADGTPSELHVITDAQTGKKLFEYQGIETGIGNSEYSGQVTIGTTPTDGGYSMTDATRGGHKTYDLKGGSSGTGTLFTDPDDTWGDGTTGDRQTAAVDAAYGAQLTWDYYKDVHGRNGIKNDGVGAYSRVHYGNNYVNAFWQDSCFCMTYGDGAGNAKPLTSIDVGAHEMTHGVTSNTAGLIYRGESGGLNEATSDIMAAAVEFHADNASDAGDYLVGEKIDIRGNGTPLRYMDKPSKDGRSADAWSSTLGSLDVHYSSGPANHWFYLASEGSGAKTVNGVDYDSPTSDGLPVTAIGRDAAAKIWYKALTTYMTSSTDYAGARTATLQAAADLYGLGSDTYVNTANAWAAINVGPRVVDGIMLTAPADQYSAVDAATSLQIQATGFNPGVLTYFATGLPEGLKIDHVTGLITGTPTKRGTSDVTITVRGSMHGLRTASFTWSIRNVFENTTDVPIPDGGAAVFSDIDVTGLQGQAPSDLKVAVDIKHTYRGDLAIDLVAPDGTVYPLKNISGSDSADDVLETYTVDASSQVANGTWRLRVRDAYRSDTGYLDGWKLLF
ncbi:thermolysin metallopeptidase [Streptomyces laurentii]|uniref:Thermolysin metallopeptidase n=2 Tax=Streptomyces laurentii TaxID=39478 RepID=A0A160P9S8_STRLU|nr:thermolysin metallopeptidase [Streptomyces laurentii]